MGFELPSSSLRNFEEALDLYMTTTKKDMSEVLNKQALNVAYRAAQFTSFAERGAILRALKVDPHLAYALTSLSLKKRGIGKLPKGQFQAEVDAFIQRRISSSRYLRTGWAPAIIALGGTFKGIKTERGADGYADKSTPAKLLAIIANVIKEPNEAQAYRAENALFPALEEAVNFVAEDMVKHAQEKLAKTATLFSP